MPNRLVQGEVLTDIGTAGVAKAYDPKHFSDGISKSEKVGETVAPCPFSKFVFVSLLTASRIHQSLIAGIIFPGIGAYFQKSNQDGQGLAVKSLLQNSPAQLCGKIKVGDVILVVNDEKVYGRKLAELAEVLLGPPGSQVKLEFKREKSNEEYTVKLTRGIPGFN